MYQPTGEQRSAGTSAKTPREALSRESALRAIAGSDPRPLLVLRECVVCNKTDNALLTPGTDNDKTTFVTRWFHCVKLPIDVVEPDHPFHALFPSNDSEHLFVSARDGSSKVALEADVARVELWNAMSKVLADAYVKDPLDLYADARSHFDELDALDRQITVLETSKAQLMEGSAPDRTKLRKLDNDIAAVRKDMTSERDAIQRLSKIDLKARSAGKTSAPAHPGH